MPKVSTCLWFGKDAEAAVRFYVSVVPGSHIEDTMRSPGIWPGGDAGDVIMMTFSLGGQSFRALNGGGPASYGTAASISVECSDQAEVDRLWAALTADGGSEIQCGWLRDKWGVPWQIVTATSAASPGRSGSGRLGPRLRRNDEDGKAGHSRPRTCGRRLTQAHPRCRLADDR